MSLLVADLRAEAADKPDGAEKNLLLQASKEIERLCDESARLLDYVTATARPANMTPREFALDVARGRVAITPDDKLL